MELDNLIMTVFCLVDDAIRTINQGIKLRQHGPNPVLDDTEVLSMEIIGELLGYSQDKAIFSYFKTHYAHFFPALKSIHRTTFTRQSANLWHLKQRLWQHLLGQIPYEPTLSVVDSFPLPACQFARALICQRFKKEAAYGYDTLAHHIFYGFRFHARISASGLIIHFSLAPANISEIAVLEGMAERGEGNIIGDRNYWSPSLREELLKEGVVLEAPFRKATHDPFPRKTKLLRRMHKVIETVFSQLVERYQIKRVWAKDIWHMMSRLLRKVLSHTVGYFLNQSRGQPPLQFVRLLP